MVTIQTFPNKNKGGGQTIQTVPNEDKKTLTKSVKTKTLTKTLSDLSTITEVVLETAEIPIESAISPQPQNNVKLWFSKNDKVIIGVSCGFIFVMIIFSIILQIKRKKDKKRAEQERVIFSPKTPKTPETPEGLRIRRILRDDVMRDE